MTNWETFICNINVNKIQVLTDTHVLYYIGICYTNLVLISAANLW